MRYFREIEPDIYAAAGALRTKADGRDWIGEYDTLLARGQPFAVIVDARDRPQPPAGKPMVLWMKARKAELGRLVRLTAYVVEDGAERAELERALPARSKSSPYPMAVAASPADALTKARSSLGRT